MTVVIFDPQRGVTMPWTVMHSVRRGQQRVAVHLMQNGWLSHAGEHAFNVMMLNLHQVRLNIPVFHTSDFKPIKLLAWFLKIV